MESLDSANQDKAGELGKWENFQKDEDIGGSTWNRNRVFNAIRD